MSREAMKHIKTWSERCEEHPDHQMGMISEGMIRARMQEEIDELRQSLETEQEPLYWSVADGWVTAEQGLVREWVGLTDEERHGIREWQEIQKELGPVWAPMMLYLYLAIEQALKEKNHG